jgi:hypothetical protein
MMMTDDARIPLAHIPRAVRFAAPVLALAGALACAASAVAEEKRAFAACPSQQQLEQVMGSNGQFVPGDCRELTITRIQTGSREVCVLDFESSGDANFLDRLRSAAVPTQWWVACENLTRR